MDEEKEMTRRNTNNKISSRIVKVMAGGEMMLLLTLTGGK